MTRDDWRELIYCIALAGAILTALLMIYSVPPFVVRLLS